MSSAGVYIIRHSSGAFYVGATYDFARRRASHWRSIRTGRGSACRRLVAFASEHGNDTEAFSFTPLLVCDRSDVLFYENRALAVFYGEPGCLNLRSSGCVHDASTRAKIGAATKRAMADPVRRAKMSRKGTKHTPEAIARMREAKRGPRNPNYGRTITEETRARRSAALAGERHPMFGKKHTEQTLAAMRSSQRDTAPLRKRGADGRFHGVEA